MQLKRMMSLVLIGLLTVSLVSPSINAADSNANIEFVPATDTPIVLDPTNPNPEVPYVPGPEEDGDPQDNPTGEAGPLTLDYVSSVSFGEQEIGASSVTYNSTTLRPFVQVTDRRGTSAGWNLTASISEFTQGEGETSITTLPGATLVFSNGTLKDGTSESTAPTVSTSITLAPSETVSPANILTAEEGAGLGTWITRWLPTDSAPANENDNVTLVVPAGSATAGEHNATITWNLEETP